MNKSLKLASDLVSVGWLHSNLQLENLVILDATINKKIDDDSLCIRNARFFDIKGKFSDLNAQFPSTLPNESQFESEAQALGINNDSVIVVYDDRGIYSSARAWWLFKTFGFNNIAVLDGGLPEWKYNNYRLSNFNLSNIETGNFLVKLQPSLMTDFNGLQSYINDPYAVIIDARSSDRFSCLVDEPRKGLRRGTIPNSINIPYTELLNKNKLKPIEELSTIFNKLVKKESKLVFSCGSGITACILALGAKLCDYNNLVVYDGSWTEYGTLTIK
ncbi:sulfurtransferase [Winogradskyella vincentii]|uniref:Sulfurtransferase n=1 Tax=Winogradskyella vincentii TaxID=2877122 RepID=A0ABS7XZN7_9FLAO|nr:sulfurtransferase [Winogradskyella vincentii]MCA0153114.1 sulfurtransferase [Winogradskyella vincentii]